MKISTLKKINECYSDLVVLHHSIPTELEKGAEGDQVYFSTEQIEDGSVAEIGYRKKPTDVLTKGHILGRSLISEVKITAMGKQLKEGLKSKILPSLEAMRIKLAAKCASIEEKVGEAPNEPCSDWTYRGIKHTYSEPLMKYSPPPIAKVKEPFDGYPASDSGPSEEEVKRKLKYEFNDCIYDLGEVNYDIAVVRAFIDHVEDGQKMLLTADQIVKLGIDIK